MCVVRFRFRSQMIYINFNCRKLWKKLRKNRDDDYDLPSHFMNPKKTLLLAVVHAHKVNFLNMYSIHDTGDVFINFLRHFYDSYN
jgi:hypothetical protein